MRVLEVLTSHANEWVNGPALCHPDVGGSEGLRRLRELRADGYIIEMRHHPDPRRKVRQYRLLLGDPMPGGTQLKMFDNGRRSRA